MYIEYSRDSGKTWVADNHHVKEGPPFDPWIQSVTAAHRNYTMFANMANVRGHSRYHYAPRGLPKDISPEVAEAAKNWGSDAHSYSWLKLEEFTKCVLRTGYSQEEIDGAAPIAFYDWIYHRSPSSPPEDCDYASIVAYIRWKLTDLQAEHTLLADPHEPKARVIFWFDS